MKTSLRTKWLYVFLCASLIASLAIGIAPVDMAHALGSSPDVWIDSASPDPVDAGSDLTYVFGYYEYSLSYDVQIYIPIPTQTTFVSVSHPNCSYDSGWVSCYWPALDADESGAITVVVNVDANATGEILMDGYYSQALNTEPYYGFPVYTTVAAGDLTPPDTTIVTKPINPTVATNATFAFSGTDNVTAPANLTYQCALDGEPYSDCAAAVLFPSLSVGYHYIYVYAVDEAGNADPTPAHYGWTIVKERVKNGGFNTYVGASKVPQYWAKNAAWSASDGKDTTSKKDGTASVKLAGQPGKTKTLTQTVAVSGAKGDLVRFSFWSRGASIPAAGSCKVDVLVYNGSALKQTKTITCKTGTYGFTKQQLNFNPTSDFTKIVVKFTYAKSSGSLWLDMVSILK